MTSIIPLRHPSPHSQRGSAIFLILIAIAILAALTAAVTSGLRLSGGTATAVSDEKMRLALSEIHSVVDATRIAVTNMVVGSGISIDTLDASDSGSDGIYYPWTNTDCLDDTCKLYKPDGGALSFYKFGVVHSDLTDIPGVVDGDPEMPVAVGWGYIEKRGTTSADIILMVRVTKDFCTFINKQIGVTADVDLLANTTPLLVSPMTAGWRANTIWMGYLTAPGYAPHLAGKTEGCYHRTSGDYRYFALIYPT